MPLAAPPVGWAADLNATPSTLSTVFAGAQGGDTIYLASGDYGTWSGGAKPATVTVKPASGATATMRLDFKSANNIRVEGLTIPTATVSATTRNVTVAGSKFTGDAVIRTDQFNNNNIIFDGNTHVGISPSGGYEGRITLPVAGPNPSGVVIQNSVFAGGASDGIQNGSNGTQILNNEFKDILQGDPNVAHSDALQLYGSRNTVIRGNYFHNVEDGIMAPDGADHEVIENNVFVTTGNQYAVTLGSDTGSVVRHNTMVVGGLRMQQKSGMGAPAGTVIKDNVMPGITREAGTADQGYNLISGSGTRTPTDIKAAPAFVGGAKPSTWAAFGLAAGSPGKGSASDGSDRGIVPVPPLVAPTAPVTPPAVAPGARKTNPNPRQVVHVRWKYRPSRPVVGTRIVLSAPRSRQRGRKCVWTIEPKTVRRGCTRVVRFSKPGLKHITLRITTRSGKVTRGTRHIRVLARS